MCYAISLHQQVTHLYLLEMVSGVIVIEGVSTGFCFSLSKDGKDLVVGIIKAPLCLIKVLQMAGLGQ